MELDRDLPTWVERDKAPEVRAEGLQQQRDPRVVLSIEAPRVPDAVASPYAVVHARATVEPSDAAWDFLDRLAKLYVTPPATFPVPKTSGYLVHYAIERIGGVGPWVSES